MYALVYGQRKTDTKTNYELGIYVRQELTLETDRQADRQLASQLDRQRSMIDITSEFELPGGSKMSIEIKNVTSYYKIS